MKNETYQIQYEMAGGTERITPLVKSEENPYKNGNKYSRRLDGKKLYTIGSKVENGIIKNDALYCGHRFLGFVIGYK